MIKLRRKIGESKPDDKPEMYDSPLFARQHPSKGKSQYSKAVEEFPDPSLENVQPNEDEKPVNVSSVDKAIDLLKSIVSKADPEPKEPDTTGKLEGKFTIPINQMIGWLNKILAAEYSQWLRYYHYAMVMRGHARDAVAEEFEVHANQELEHAGVIGLRVVGLGGYPLPAIDRPSPLKKIEDILKELLHYEQQGMALYKKVLSFCGENEGTKQILEANVEVEQEHIDELWRYTNAPEVKKAGADQESAGRITSPSDAQAKREYDHSFARQTEGESGSPTPDLPERGRDWHGTVPGVPDEPQDGDEDQEEAQKYFKPPKDFLNPEEEDQTDKAIKALAGASRFTRGSVIPPREREFMLQNGYTPVEIESGAVMTPRLRAEFNQFVANSVHKSLSSLEKHGR
jgi:bacterioferritin